MELLSGRPLERHLTRTTTGLLHSRRNDDRRRLSLLQALGISRQLATALEHIHERHVINLDLKPSNVLLRRQNLDFLRESVPQVVLCDFGISRDLRYPRAGLLGVATPEYVSPEQTSELGRHHRRLDGRSDIFSLGIVLYEMLTGTLPFDSIVLVADPTYTPTPPRQLRPPIPPLLDEIVMKALAKDPAYRFQTTSEMLATLNQVPTPSDWAAATRRTFAGVTLAACITAGGWGIKSLVATSTPTPIPTPPPVIETATRTPTAPAAPATPTPTVSPAATRRAPTSTPAPTFTPTNTPRPVTPTFTPTPEG